MLDRITPHTVIARFSRAIQTQLKSLRVAPGTGLGRPEDKHGLSGQAG